ncbi:hypothetical protein Bbelb_311480 [Branchiostoma belcheri]|nr:hypothetical protein Bbelb_311480 [Branchiostoma belcheri]
MDTQRAQISRQKYRSNGFLSQHSVYRGEAASVLDLQCRRTRLPAPRVTEHWNDPVRSALLRDFGTCYPVVNVSRALVKSAEWNSAPAIQWLTASERWLSSGERPPSAGYPVVNGLRALANEC